MIFIILEVFHEITHVSLEIVPLQGVIYIHKYYIYIYTFTMIRRIVINKTKSVILHLLELIVTP